VSFFDHRGGEVRGDLTRFACFFLTTEEERLRRFDTLRMFFLTTEEGWLREI